MGIDPGLASTGIGIVRGTTDNIASYSFGSINTLQDDSLPFRLHEIYTGLVDALKDVKPDLMVVEDVFSLKAYPKSGISLGKVSGVVRAHAPMFTTTPTPTPTSFPRWPESYARDRTSTRGLTRTADALDFAQAHAMPRMGSAGLF